VLVEDVRRFEASLLKFVESSRPGVLAAIAEQKTLTDQIKADLKQVLDDFKDEWKKQSVNGEGDFPVTAPAKPATAAAAPQPA
jgi:hypothetical protein